MYNDDYNDPYDREYSASINPSDRYDLSQDFQYQSSMDHFLYNRGNDDD